MQLTSTSEYAIRAIIHLAGFSPGTTVQISRMSEEEEIPDNFLRKIVPVLSKSGFIRTRRGVGGGIALAVEPDSISILDIIEAVEGKIFLNKCLIGPAMCHRSSWCKVHEVWYEAQEDLKVRLRSRTIAELAESMKR